jgi:hypothetical protein
MERAGGSRRRIAGMGSERATAREARAPPLSPLPYLLMYGSVTAEWGGRRGTWWAAMPYGTRRSQCVCYSTMHRAQQPIAGETALPSLRVLLADGRSTAGYSTPVPYGAQTWRAHKRCRHRTKLCFRPLRILDGKPENLFRLGRIWLLGPIFCMVRQRDASSCASRTGHGAGLGCCLIGCAEFFGPAEMNDSVCLVSYEPSNSLTTYTHGDLTSHLLAYHKASRRRS